MGTRPWREVAMDATFDPPKRPRRARIPPVLRPVPAFPDATVAPAVMDHRSLLRGIP